MEGGSWSPLPALQPRGPGPTLADPPPPLYRRGSQVSSRSSTQRALSPKGMHRRTCSTNPTLVREFFNPLLRVTPRGLRGGNTLGAELWDLTGFRRQDSFTWSQRDRTPTHYEFNRQSPRRGALSDGRVGVNYESSITVTRTGKVLHGSLD